MTRFAREDLSVSLKSIGLSEMFAFVRSEKSKSETLCSGLKAVTASKATSEETQGERDVTLTITHVIEAAKSSSLLHGQHKAATRIGCQTRIRFGFDVESR